MTYRNTMRRALGRIETLQQQLLYWHSELNAATTVTRRKVIYYRLNRRRQMLRWWEDQIAQGLIR